MSGYAEIGVTTNYSFLRGASHPVEMVGAAQYLGLDAIGIADRNTLAGVVRAYAEWEKLDAATRPRLLIGARLVFRDNPPDILAYPQDRAAYGRLCQLLSEGKHRAPDRSVKSLPAIAGSRPVRLPLRGMPRSFPVLIHRLQISAMVS